MCPRAQGVRAADKKVSERGNAIPPYLRAPVSFKRLLGGSFLVGLEQFEGSGEEFRDRGLVCVRDSRDRSEGHPHRPTAKRGITCRWRRCVRTEFMRPVVEDGGNTHSGGLERLASCGVGLNDCPNAPRRICHSGPSPVEPPNGSRLSCGASAEGRKRPALRYEFAGAQTYASSEGRPRQLQALVRQPDQ